MPMEYDRIRCYCSCRGRIYIALHVQEYLAHLDPECESHFTFYNTNAVQTPYGIPTNLCHQSREWGGWLRRTKSGTNTMPGNASNADS